MKKQFLRTCTALLSGMVLSIPAGAQDMAENPFIRTETDGVTPLYTADPSAHVWEDGRLYVYASHDVDPPQGCDFMDGYHVFSTDDMITWVDHGEILHSRDVPWGRSEGGFMWAPDCAYNPGNQTYYFYFPHPTGDGDAWNNTWKIGIATSKEPAANFQVQGYIEGLESLIDPCVFVDDDGQPYLYHGGGGKCMGGKLDKNDWTKLDGQMVQMTGLSDFHEGAWVHKYNGKYYLSHSDNKSPNNQLKYAIGDTPLGPWEDKGVYLGPTDSDTSHGSIVEYKGQWYAFYHNSVLSHNLSKNGALRSICVDKLYYNEDGTIQRVIQTGMDFEIPVQKIPGIIEAENYGNDGEGISFHDNTPVNQGQEYRRAAVDIEECVLGGYNVFNTEDGEWLAYDVNINQSNTYRMEVRVASETGGIFHVEMDGIDITGPVEVPATGGSQVWKSLFIPGLELTAGRKAMKVCIDKGGFNLDNYAFSLDIAPPIGEKIVMTNSGKYVTIRNSSIYCDKKPPLTVVEEFLVEDAGDGLIALKGNNGSYWGAGAIMNCTRPGIVPMAKFSWCALSANQVCLKSDATNRVVCSMNGESAMTCDRETFDGWETFTWGILNLSPVENITEQASGIEVYPVPAQEVIHVAFETNTPFAATIEIIDLQGKVVRNIPVSCTSGKNELEIDITALAAGIYMLRIHTPEFEEVKKITII